MPKIKQNDFFLDAGSLHYPDDLATGYTHPDIVKITIGTNPGVSLKKLTDQATDFIQSSQAEILNKLTEQRNKLKSLELPDAEKEAKLKAINKEIKSLAGRQVSGQLSIGDFGQVVEKGLTNAKSLGKRALNAIRQGNEKNVFTPIKSIFLPMPENLVYNEPVDWQGTDLGMMKAGADALLGKGGSDNALGGAALGQAGNVLAGGAGAIVSKLLGGGLLGGAVLGGLGGGASLQGAIESNLRVKSNPFKEQTFQGVGFRPFEFSFVFNARSQSEVNTIRRIINSFRKYSKPSLDSPESAIFKYPGEFEIEFLTVDQGGLIDNEYLPKLKRCICKSVNTNFTTAGWRSFEEGAPTTITLQLGFEEVDIITSEQVEIEGDGF